MNTAECSLCSETERRLGSKIGRVQRGVADSTRIQQRGFAVVCITVSGRGFSALATLTVTKHFVHWLKLIFSSLSVSLHIPTQTESQMEVHIDATLGIVKRAILETASRPHL